MGEIRRLTEEDYGAVLALTEFSFQLKIEAEQMEQKKREINTHTIWGYTIDNELAGKVHIIPLQTFINGKEFSMGGIGAVSTWPEYRRSGIAKKLMHRCLVDMKEQGQVISFLHPFHVGFYRKLGWEIIIEQKQYTIPTESLRKDWQTSGFVRRIAKDISLLDAIYRPYAIKYNGMLVRDKTWWQDKVLADESAQVAIMYNESNEAEGYVVYKVRDEIFTIIDIAYTTMKGYRLMMEFIANHDSMAEKVIYLAAQNDPLPLLVDNPRFESVNHPYFMGRIVDVPNFLRQLPVTEVKRTVTLYVEDEFFAENTGTYTVRTENGVTQVTKIPGKITGAISCSVQQLTAISMGQRRPLELLALELISGDIAAVQTLEEIIPQTNTFLADFF